MDWELLCDDFLPQKLHMFLAVPYGIHCFLGRLFDQRGNLLGKHKRRNYSQTILPQILNRSRVTEPKSQRIRVLGLTSEATLPNVNVI